jgi:hypothetical protein
MTDNPAPVPGATPDPLTQPDAANKPHHMSDAELMRVEVVISELSKRGNLFAVAIHKSLKQKSKEDKRKIIANAYAMMYNALLSINMAIESQNSPLNVQRSLTMLRRLREQKQKGGR